jgi:hypothetical protein
LAHDRGGGSFDTRAPLFTRRRDLGEAAERFQLAESELSTGSVGVSSGDALDASGVEAECVYNLPGSLDSALVC